MNIVPRPHVSDAIKQLRGWVTLAAIVVGLACATQMMVFGFAAYTQVRWEEVKAAGVDHSLRVVGAIGGGASTSAGAPAAASSEAASLDPTVKATPAVAAPVRGQVGSALGHKATEPNMLKSPADLWMRRASDLAAGLGSVAVVCLFFVTMLGAVVAGGGAVPGVERAVTSAVWSMMLCVLCLPWSRALPAMGVQGVFASFDDMTWSLDAQGPGTPANVPLGLVMQWIGAPACGLLAAIGVAIWFRAGVERGVLVLSPTDLERQVVREAEMIQKRGVATCTPKAMGALSQAMSAGVPPSAKSVRGAPAGTLSAVEKALNEKELAGVGSGGAAAPARPVARGKMSGSVADEDFRRPI